MYIPNRGGKINILVQKLQIADSNGFWHRNTNTLRKIRSSSLYRDEIVEALGEECQHLKDYVATECLARAKDFKIPKELHLGGWFYELLYRPHTLYYESGKLSVKIHSWSEDYSCNHEAAEGEDPYYETDNIQVTLK